MKPDPDSLVVLIARGISQRTMYFADHPRVLANCRKFIDQLEEFLIATKAKQFFIGVIEDQLVFEGRQLVGPTIVGRKMIRFAEYLNCGGFSFSRSVDAEELSEFFNLSAELNEPLEHLEEARKLMDSRGILHITAAPYYQDPQALAATEEDENKPWRGEESRSRAEVLLHQALFDTVENAHMLAARGLRLDIEQTQAVSEQLLQSIPDDFSDIMQLVGYDDVDSYTVGHSVRVAVLALIAGHNLGLETADMQDLATAGLLHDVGKSQIPEDILFKPGALDDVEWHIMETHSRLGAEILLEQEDASPLAIAAAWGHHQNHDRGGYPDVPDWAFRSQATALIQVCDVFEALTAIRPYKPRIGIRRAYEIMLGMRGLLNPACLSLFIRALGLYPPGANIRLSDGRRAIVLAAGKKLEKPVVRLTCDAEGRPVPQDASSILDLAADGQENVSVIGMQDETIRPLQHAH